MERAHQQPTGAPSHDALSTADVPSHYFLDASHPQLNPAPLSQISQLNPLIPNNNINNPQGGHFSAQSIHHQPSSIQQPPLPSLQREFLQNHPTQQHYNEIHLHQQQHQQQQQHRQHTQQAQTQTQNSLVQNTYQGQHQPHHLSSQSSRHYGLPMNLGQHLQSQSETTQQHPYPFQPRQIPSLEQQPQHNQQLQLSTSRQSSSRTKQSTAAANSGSPIENAVLAASQNGTTPFGSSIPPFAYSQEQQISFRSNAHQSQQPVQPNRQDSYSHGHLQQMHTSGIFQGQHGSEHLLPNNYSAWTTVDTPSTSATVPSRAQSTQGLLIHQQQQHHMAQQQRQLQQSQQQMAQQQRQFQQPQQHLPAQSQFSGPHQGQTSSQLNNILQPQSLQYAQSGASADGTPSSTGQRIAARPSTQRGANAGQTGRAPSASSRRSSRRASADGRTGGPTGPPLPVHMRNPKKGRARVFRKCTSCSHDNHIRRSNCERCESPLPMGKRRKDVKPSPATAGRNTSTGGQPSVGNIQALPPQSLGQSLAQVSSQQHQQVQQRQQHHQGYLGHMPIESDALTAHGVTDPRVATMGMGMGGLGNMNLHGQGLMLPPVTSSPVSGIAPPMVGTSGATSQPGRSSR